MASQDRTRGRAYVDGLEPCLIGEPATPSLDPNEIFASVGEVAYEWHLDSDTIVWGSNVLDVLAIGDPATIATGRSFADLVDPNSCTSRNDAVRCASAQDEGPGEASKAIAAVRSSLACATPAR